MAPNTPNPVSPSPSGKGAPGFARQLANVLDLPIMLVGATVIGAGAGYLLDQRLHSSPWLALLLGIAGFAGGMYEILRRLTGKRQRDDG
ncbi:MAG: AtpZ/AtpI family protein [Candidatus Acidiferrales bacterium]